MCPVPTGCASCSRKRLYLVKALTTLAPLLLLSTARAQSGSYTSPGPSGGTTSSTPQPGPPPKSYGSVSGGYGGSVYNGVYLPAASGQTASATCTGAINQTYTWHGTDPAPQSAIVTQTCTAGCQSFNSPPGTGGGTPTCDDGLQDSPNITTITYPLDSPPTVTPGTRVTGISTGTHYMVLGGSSIPLTCTPKVNVSPGHGSAYASVAYSSSVSPVTITLSGTVQDSSGGYDILIGQGGTASLAGIPSNCTVSNYQWSVGGTRFQTWSATTPATPTTPVNPNASYYVDGPGPVDQSTAHWYWNEATTTTRTVSCTAMVIAPDGTPLTVNATKQVNVMVPGWTCTGTGGTMQVNASAPNDSNIALYAGPTSGSGGNGGMIWRATVTSPNPVLFKDGSLAIAQIITPDGSFTALNAFQVPTTYPGSQNGQTGLDAFPYPWSPGPQPPQYAGGDAPGFDLTSDMLSAHSADQFNDYLMYQPPGSAQWVPLATFDWSTSGNATQPNPGGWAAFGSGSAGPVKPSGSPVPFTKGNSFPMWTQSDAGRHF